MPERRSLEDLAGAIADRTDVDWAAAESSAGSEHERDVVLRLRRIGEIAGAHRSHDPRVVSAATGDSRGDMQQWGHLTLLAKVGDGAFGEVYRAWDTKLDREVALKLLHDGDAATGATTSSVVEEGRVLAKVRHPNVVTVYGADRIDDRVGVWMDFIHGNTLEHLLVEQGVFSAREAMLIGLDLCRALAAVHSAGFVHRDVKAPNVMREDGGRIVVMDFGTGRERANDGGAPTATPAGTPLYVAPEVLAGGEASIASDIYAIGTLLYHLVTGRFPIAATTLADVKEAHRSRHRVRLRDARPDLPDAFVRVVERAIAPHPRERFASAGAMEAALAAAQFDNTRRLGARWVSWTLAAALVVSTATAVALWMRTDPTGGDRVTTFIEGAGLQLDNSGLSPSFAISDDGLRLAYVAEVAGGHILYTRALGDSSARELLRAEHVISNPTFSPDGRTIAFFMRTDADLPNTPRLCRVSVAGGPPVTLATAAFGGRGIAWGADGAIVYISGAAPNLWRTSESGETPRRLTTFKVTDLWRIFRPQILPNGAVLFSAQQRTGPARAMALLPDGAVKPILEDADRARFVAPASLVFGRDKSLMGVRFDPARLSVLDPAVQLGTRSAGGWFDVSRSGSLITADATGPAADRERTLVWIERDTGRETPSGLPARRYLGPSVKLSPNGRALAVGIADDDVGPIGHSQRRTWLGDLERRTLSEFAAEGTKPLAWSPDGRHVTLQDATGRLTRRAIDGATPEETLAPAALFGDQGIWTPDGRMFVTAGKRVLMWPSANVVGREKPIIDTTWSTGATVPATTGNASAFSSNGRWITYHSVTANRVEVYARIFRAPGPVVRISVNGGQDPRWVGNDIYYWEPGTPIRIMAVRVDQRHPTLSSGAPRVVANLAGDELVDAFQVAPDGRRFLVLRKAALYPWQLRVVLNWMDGIADTITPGTPVGR